MYGYDQHDQEFLQERVGQFRDQVERFTQGKLDPDKFRNLRLRNGLYQELHAYMLRVAIPYGVLNSVQLKQLALIADKYDRGYGHFTTRQNIQFNWLEVSQVGGLLQQLAAVDMHAIQTSGKVVRNIVTSHLAGVDPNEIVDPRIYCEIIRQWFTVHPEFSWLGGKFKIAVNATKNSELAVKFNDLGLDLIKHNNQLGAKIWVGGGLGAAPMIGQEIKSFLPVVDILSYLESILRVYNLHGRRDNPKRNRIKFLVKDLGINKFKQLVDKDWQQFNNSATGLQLTADKIEQIAIQFKLPISANKTIKFAEPDNDNFKLWHRNNISANKVAGFSVAAISLTGVGKNSGDINSSELISLANIADKYSCGEIRTTTKQNLILPYVRQDEEFALWQDLNNIGLAKPYQNTFAHIVSCPGADYCSLAKTSAISATSQIQQEFAELIKLQNIGKLSLSISGCENSCAHHHIADIGLLGLKKGELDFYQITLGGQPQATIGKKLGAAISSQNIVLVIEKIIKVFVANRTKNESFNSVLSRLGIKVFKVAVYEN